MTEFEGWQIFHGNCKEATVTHHPKSGDVRFHCPVHGIDYNRKTPYPFCRTPLKCAGNGYCKAEFACND